MLSTKSASAMSSTSSKPSDSNSLPIDRTHASWAGDDAVPQIAYLRMAQLYRGGFAIPRRASGGQQLPEDVGEDPAVAEVFALARRVEPERRAELRLVRANGHLARLATLDPDDRELLAPGQPERLAALAREELERQDPHHQQVRAVDPLVALGDHRSHAEKLRSLRRPVARRARAVLLARERSEERRVGKECRFRWSVDHEKRTW